MDECASETSDKTRKTRNCALFDDKQSGNKDRRYSHLNNGSASGSGSFSLSGSAMLHTIDPVSSMTWKGTDWSQLITSFDASQLTGTKQHELWRRDSCLNFQQPSSLNRCRRHRVWTMIVHHCSSSQISACYGNCWCSFGSFQFDTS